MDLALENEVRAVAFRWLDEQEARHGDVLEAALLRTGFEFRGGRVRLAVQQGIYKPKFLDAALSLRTSFDSPYSDHFEGEDTLVYRYQGTDPDAWDNVAVRLAYEHGLPLVYLHAVSSEPRYVAVRPVLVVGDDPRDLAFRLQAMGAGLPMLSGRSAGAVEAAEATAESLLERRYATRLVRTRLHQETFRQRVLRAYRDHCAMCSLRHPKLLDAAHIDADAGALGEPVVSNGLSLCRIHHGAFDLRYLSVEPDTYRVRVLPAILDEEDGPMLRHGLQDLEGVKLVLPRRTADRPDPERLRRHWERFQAAG